GLAASLSSAACSYVGTTSKSVQIIDCNIVLSFAISSFTGKLQDGLANLQWVGSNETAGIKYIIERSDDQTHFTPVGSLEGQSTAGGDVTYHFTDPKAIQG